MAYKALKQFVQKNSTFDERDGTWISWKRFNPWDLEELVRACVKERTLYNNKRLFNR